MNFNMIQYASKSECKGNFSLLPYMLAALNQCTLKSDDDIVSAACILYLYNSSREKSYL